MSVLYIVSTPIGNLEDLTHRAASVLATVDRVLAEDTRRTAILLRHYDIRTPLVSAHEHNEAARAAQVVDWLDAGENLALVSDAGTPLLSDPGLRLVRSVVDRGHDVVAVPGPSAVLAALVVSGLEPEPFTFYGFTPRGGRDRRQRLDELAALDHTAVLYEAPARLLDLLDDLIAACGGDRSAVVARELTKMYESVERGTLTTLREIFEKEPPRGEIALLLGAAMPAVADPAAAANLARSLLATGDSPRSVARELARRLHMPRNEAYSMVVSLVEGRQEK